MQLRPVTFVIASLSSTMWLSGCAVFDALHFTAEMADCLSSATKPCFPMLDKARAELRGTSSPSVTDSFDQTLTWVGSFEGNVAFPPGDLHVSTPTIVPVTPGLRQTWLVVNLSKPTSSGEQSFAALVVVDCTAASLAVARSEWLQSRNAAGLPNRFDEHLPHVAVHDDSSAWRASIDLVCR